MDGQTQCITETLHRPGDEMKASLRSWYLSAGIVPAAAAVLYLGALILAFRKLPQEVPVHFDFKGVANGWMGKGAWAVVSPIIVGSVVALVFATRPGPFDLTAIMYWCACGLVIGAFFQINRAAQAQRPFHFLPVLAWLLLVPVCQFIASGAFANWWKSLK